MGGGGREMGRYLMSAVATVAVVSVRVQYYLPAVATVAVVSVGSLYIRVLWYL